MVIEVRNYKSPLGVIETQRAIKEIKDDFQVSFAKKLNLLRVSAPLFLKKSSGLNDDLNGVERKVHFTAHELGKEEIQVVQSLAKWKRYALGKYEIPYLQGLYTDMNAIRRDETLDNLHSLYVDQWDWEVHIKKEDRTKEFLEETVKKIYEVLKAEEKKVKGKYSCFDYSLPENIAFLDTSDLERDYPSLSRKEREKAAVKKYGAVFLERIGWPLKDGKPHDGRADDYDDWNLNGDIILYHPLLDLAYEISSMGIRVDKESLRKQCEYKHELFKLDLPYDKAILEDKIPLSIGGGIGQSRLCMFFLEKAHIGEVQTSLWPEEDVRKCEEMNIHLL